MTDADPALDPWSNLSPIPFEAGDDFWGPGGRNATGRILMRLRAELQAR